MVWRQSQTPHAHALMPMPMPHTRWRRRTIASTLGHSHGPFPWAVFGRPSLSLACIACVCLTFYIHAPRAAAAAAAAAATQHGLPVYATADISKGSSSSSRSSLVGARFFLVNNNPYRLSLSLSLSPSLSPFPRFPRLLSSLFNHPCPFSNFFLLGFLPYCRQFPFEPTSLAHPSRNPTGAESSNRQPPTTAKKPLPRAHVTSVNAPAPSNHHFIAHQSTVQSTLPPEHRVTLQSQSQSLVAVPIPTPSLAPLRPPARPLHYARAPRLAQHARFNPCPSSPKFPGRRIPSHTTHPAHLTSLHFTSTHPHPQIAPTTPPAPAPVPVSVPVPAERCLQSPAHPPPAQNSRCGRQARSALSWVAWAQGNG